MTLLPAAKITAGICLAVSAFLCGCEPYNAEQTFPLPDRIWDRVVRMDNVQAFEIKDLEFQEFINLKALLLSSNFVKVNRDFYFSSRSEKGKTLFLSSSKAEILVRETPLKNGKFPAAAYISKEKRLLLGSGTPEK